MASGFRCDVSGITGAVGESMSGRARRSACRRREVWGPSAVKALALLGLGCAALRVTAGGLWVDVEMQ